MSTTSPDAVVAAPAVRPVEYRAKPFDSSVHGISEFQSPLNTIHNQVRCFGEALPLGNATGPLGPEAVDQLFRFVTKDERQARVDLDISPPKHPPSSSSWCNHQIGRAHV